jgi:lycopene cyclase domain-containing protein
VSWWQHTVYPGILIVSLGCLVLVDYKWHLAFWHNRRRALIVLLVSVIFFTIWDIAGIQLAIFSVGADTYRSGLLLGPSFPVEELLFLTLLNYTVLLGWAYGSRRNKQV